MCFRVAFATLPLLVVAAVFVRQLGAGEVAEKDDAKIKSLIDHGDYTAAEKLLQAQVADPKAPITGGPAVQIEILRRVRRDFALTNEQVLAEIKKTVPDATQKDVDHWRESGGLQYRMIDGEPRYFTARCRICFASTRKPSVAR